MNGLLIILSGPSGVGKGTVRKVLVQDESLNLAYSISMTTRGPRNGEVEGKDYFFVTKEKFLEALQKNELLEHARFVDNYYGTPKDKIQEKLNNGCDVILEIEIQGALKVKEMIPDAIFIFIMPPSMRELRKRLVNRGTDSADKILSRFRRAYQEINEVTKYNYVVINEDDKTAMIYVTLIPSKIWDVYTKVNKNENRLSV